MTRLALFCLLWFAPPCPVYADPALTDPAHADPAACPSPADDSGDDDTTLSDARAAMRAGGDLPILALGTTLAAGPEPLATVQIRLAAALPNVRPRITPLGGHGLPATDLLEQLRAELPKHPYKLVLWQTGTVEAARNLNPGEFRDALEEGATLVREARADLILIDPQFSRFLQANADVAAYLGPMQLIAALPEVGLFRRFDLTHQWADDGLIDLEHADRGNQKSVAEHLQRCVGAALADYVLRITVRRPD